MNFRCADSVERRRNLIVAVMAPIFAMISIIHASAQQRVLPEIEQPVEFVWDDRGIPAIYADSFADAMFAQGYIHAADRFFQMDGARRMAAGELAEAFGPTMLRLDQQYRRYRFRHIAQQVVQQMDGQTREMFERYAAGVNYAIETWARPPFEYVTLGAVAAEWQPEDSVLITLLMYDMMHVEGRIERSVGVMHDALPAELVEFLTPLQTRFDALLAGTELGGNDWEPAPIPSAEVVDLRTRAQRPDSMLEAIVQTSMPAMGSNNWAVSGTRTEDGRAILANDPHLQFQVPTVWYRAELSWPNVQLAGLTMPGIPGVTIGSNTHIAWGLTNSMYDFQDYIVIDVDPDDPSRYRTPDGYESFGEVEETITVRGRGVETLTLRTTRWGVVTDEDHRGRPLVLKWTALDPSMINVNLIDIFEARSLEDGVWAFRNWGGPSMNVLIASRDGRVAWVVSGAIPRRRGFDGSRPVSWAEPGVGWDGVISENDRPVLIDPPGGILFTANNRTLLRDTASAIGGAWASGTRARRIFELLNDANNVDEHDLLQMQLDTRVAMFDFYRDLAMEAIEYCVANEDVDAVAREQLAISRRLIEQWNGTADGDQAALRLLYAFRSVLHRRVIGPLVAPARDLDRRFVYQWFMDEEPLRRILESRPAHLLAPGYENWPALIAQSWHDTLQTVARTGGDEGFHTRWDESNRLSVRHPLADAMPALARSLGWPNDPQPGHRHALRVATPRFGASARMVVSPGWEYLGILHMPGGQSGDPQSPHFIDGHEDWRHGRATPFRSGEPVRRDRWRTPLGP